MKENTLKWLLGLPQRCKLTFLKLLDQNFHESRGENHTPIRISSNARPQALTMSFDCTARTPRKKSCSFCFFPSLHKHDAGDPTCQLCRGSKGRGYRPQCETHRGSRGLKNGMTCAVHVLNFSTWLIVNTGMKTLSPPLVPPPNYR